MMKKRNKLLLCMVFALLCCAGCMRSKSPTAVEKEQTSQRQDREENDASQETDTATSATKEEETMKISIRTDTITLIYELNQSQAARSLYAQLPLTLEIQDYSTNEKIFYPPQELSLEDTPLADAKQGTLAYYAPWGDVVLFYDDFGKGSQLYALGEIISGKEQIENLQGNVTIAPYQE